MRTREQKIHRCLPRLAVHSYLIGPICQFAPSTRGARISPGADPIFRSACCAGYCQDNGAVKVLVVDAQGRNVCRQIFTENRHWPRASFSDMLEKYDRHSIGIFEDLCAAMRLYVYPADLDCSFQTFKLAKYSKLSYLGSLDKHNSWGLRSMKKKKVKKGIIYFYKLNETLVRNNSI